MQTKNFQVRFFVLNVQSADPENGMTGPSLFQKLYEAASVEGLCPTHMSNSVGFEIRDFYRFNQGTVYRGTFATIRDDAPHIREAHGGERTIQLENNEGILEKNHFFYYASQSLLVYQVNMRASHPTRLESYLQSMVGAAHTISLDDMLTLDAWRKLQQGIVKQFDVTFDKPKDPTTYNPCDFTSGNLRMMDAAGAGSVRLVIKAARGKGSISRWVKTTARELKRDP